jgi:ABC-type Mn2+/Zn2+ transport system ATPase subunit
MRRFVYLFLLIAMLGIPCFASKVLTDEVGRKDELTQNLDIGRQIELIDLLHFIRAEGITIFASIHDLQLLEGNFSALYLLSPGSPLISGVSEDVLKPSILEKAFNCLPQRHPLLLEREQNYTKRAG